MTRDFFNQTKIELESVLNNFSRLRDAEAEGSDLFNFYQEMMADTDEILGNLILMEDNYT